MPWLKKIFLIKILPLGALGYTFLPLQSKHFQCGKSFPQKPDFSRYEPLTRSAWTYEITQSFLCPFFSTSIWLKNYESHQ